MVFRSNYITIGKKNFLMTQIFLHVKLVIFSDILAELKFVVDFSLIDWFFEKNYLNNFRQNIFHLMFWKINTCQFCCKQDRKIPNNPHPLQNNLPDFPLLQMISIIFLCLQNTFRKKTVRKIIWVHSPSVAE